MTTIVAYNGMLACESLISDGSTKEMIANPKIRRVGEYLYGISGDLCVQGLLWDWIESGGAAPDAPVTRDGSGWSVIRVGAGGVHILTNDDWSWVEYEQPCGVGSGWREAAASIDTLVDPEWGLTSCWEVTEKDMRRAVYIASKRDIHSGGHVRVLKL